MNTTKLKQTDNLSNISITVKTYLKFLIKWLLSVFIVLLTQFIFYLYNRNSFHIESGDIVSILVGNLRFSVSIVSLLLIPYFVISMLPFLRSFNPIQKLMSVFYTLVNFILVFTSFIDVYYYQFSPKRSTLSVFDMFFASSPNLDFLKSLIKDYWLGALILIGLTYLSDLLCNKLSPVVKRHLSKKLIYSYLVDMVLFLLVLVCLIYSYRGFGRKPIGLVNTLDYVKADLSDLVVNTPFMMLKNMDNKDLVQIKKFEDKSVLEQIYTPLIKTGVIKDNKDSRLKCLLNTEVKNIVLIMLESFSPEYVGAYNPNMKETTTPFLDSIIKQSVWFKGFATSSNTAQAFVSLHLGIPALLNDSYIFSKYSTNKVKSLPQVLKDHGFITNFMTADNNGVLYFDSFSSSIGFDHYYAKKEYDNFAPGNSDYNGTWGVYDDKFFNFVAHILSTSRQPFFTTFLTTASHHPFLLPPEYQSVFVQKEGEHPIVKMVRYTDMALRNLFKKIETTDWYQNTLFIFTADHNTYLSPQASANSRSKFEIPIFFYKPSWTCSGRVDELISQVDLFPIILDILGIKENIISVGKGLDYQDRYVSVKNNGLYTLIKKDYLIRSNEDASWVFCEPENSDSSKCKHFKKDQRFFEAFLQQYTSRIILNKTYPSDE